MKREFVNRERELEFLEEAYKEQSPQLIIVYGRRRVGKSHLLGRFKEDKAGVYYLCSKGNEREQINFISKAFGEFLDDTALLLNPFSDWHSLFVYIHEKAKDKKMVWIVDEFPFLVNANPAISSIFQKYWDEYLSKTRLMLVLCGSSIGMMESETLAYGAPLYGRRTGQWKVLPLKFRDVLKFFPPNPALEETIKTYSITGGIPFYLSELDLEKTAMENITERIAKKGRVLYEEGEFLIKEELREPMTYFSILNAMAAGRTKQTDIANAISMPSTAISRYLDTLIRLGFIEREVPVTEKNLKSKKAIYGIGDNFLQFWFRFIYPSRGHVEEGDRKAVERALGDFNLHVSRVFEKKIAREALEECRKKKTVFEFQKMGRWWGHRRDESDGKRKTEEIDIIALNEDTNEILFGECKWQDAVDATKILAELKEKAKQVEWNFGNRKEHYAIFAKSFRERIREPALALFDLEDLKRIFR